jgi:capsular exopolysaccharide synthesis family protein
VRTGLFFSTQGKGHKVVQVTSPSAGDGKSTLAANLAVSISQVKKKVLLIDADLRRPTLHKVFGLSASQGLSSVLLEEAELADVIQPSGIEGLSILPCGPIPANPAELLSLPPFKELVDYVREQYDFVIIDTPPMLAVTDPCMVVPLVDGVLLALRPSKQAQPTAVRAKEVLTTLNATIIGVVVNAFDDPAAGVP